MTPMHYITLCSGRSYCEGVYKSRDVLTILRENIPTSAADPDTTYPLEAAGMMAECLGNATVACPVSMYDWENCPSTDEGNSCNCQEVTCWLQYFRERAEE